jgi:hypothetical protein|tara:strand:- start:1735 stop:1878 length:144 start_codon:yes stop_codon:yes gene_type:complete
MTIYSRKETTRAIKVMMEVFPEIGIKPNTEKLICLLSARRYFKKLKI